MFILIDIKKFQKQTLLSIFFSFDLALCKKVSYLVFSIDLYFAIFCDEIKFENFKKSPKKQVQGLKIKKQLFP
jgi:hypothetical protein